MKRKTKKSKVLPEDIIAMYDRTILRGLCALNCFLIEYNYPERYTKFKTFRKFLLRTSQQMRMLEETGEVKGLYDSDPLVMKKQSLAGFVSYHKNPYSQFFNLDINSFIKELEIDNDQDVDEHKVLMRRVKTLHAIMQTPTNVCIDNAMTEDKLDLGVGCKVMEKDDHAIMQAVHFIPEDTAIGSTNGRTQNVFGVRERLSGFEIVNRYPEMVDKRLEKQLKREPFEQSEAQTLYRYNIQFKDFKQLLGTYMDHEKDNSIFFQYLQEKFKNGSKNIEDSQWLDIAFTDNGIVFYQVHNNRNIIVSQYMTPMTSLSLSHGLLDQLLPIIVLFNETIKINLTAYERTYAPSYAVADSSKSKDIKLERDKIIYLSDINDIKDMSVRLDMGGPLQIANYLKDKLYRGFKLDTFNLLAQTHMTQGEVSQRVSESARQLGPFVSQDEADNLTIEVNFCNEQVHSRLKNSDKLADKILSAKYSSELASAHKNDMLSKTVRLNEALMSLSKVFESSPEFKNFLDVNNHAKQLLLNFKMDSYINSEETEQRLKEEQTAKDERKALMENAQLNQAELNNEQVTANIKQTGDNDVKEESN